MRVRDRNGFYTTQLTHGFRSFVIQKADTIPEDIPLLTAYQESALPNGERGLRANTHQPWLLFLENIMQTICLHLCQCCPLLAVKPHILALITTDRTFRWWLLALSKLSTTGYANPMLHLN